MCYLCMLQKLHTYILVFVTSLLCKFILMNTLTRITSVVILMCSIIALPMRAVTPEEAAKKIGEEVSIEGTVAQVSVTAAGNVYLNFGGRHPNEVFCAYVRKDSTETVNLDFLRMLEGKAVVLTGKVAEHNGKPQIVITKKEQVTVAAAPKTETPAPDAPTGSK